MSRNQKNLSFWTSDAVYREIRNQETGNPLERVGSERSEEKQNHYLNFRIPGARAPFTGLGRDDYSISRKYVPIEWLCDLSWQKGEEPLPLPPLKRGIEGDFKGTELH